MSDNNIYYVAFDPGKATGVAAFNQQGEILDTKILKNETDLDNYLDTLEDRKTVKVIIYEKYRVGFSYGQLTTNAKYGRTHGGKSVPAEQAIGSILRTARKLKTEIVSQEPAILPVAAKWSGIPLPKNHDQSHHISALNHGIYYLTNKGILKPRVLNNYQK